MEHALRTAPRLAEELRSRTLLQMGQGTKAKSWSMAPDEVHEIFMRPKISTVCCQKLRHALMNAVPEEPSATDLFLACHSAK